MATANLALRFVVELVGVGALAYSSFQASSDGVIRTALAIGAPLALIVVWALVVAPNATNALTQPQRDVVGTALLVLVALAMAATGQPAAAIVFGAVVVLNWALLIVFGPDAAAALIRSAAGRGNEGR
ncbi:MAG TPA: YrdB family protein [Candidatus Limnocylindrales bacterium]|nr:YrdB family protein [Candidatus Limnocylindrales bacterium]